MRTPSRLLALFRRQRLPRCINDVLPCEVLAHVFDFLQMDDLLRASRICAFWRNTALSTPHLWAQLLDPQLDALPTLLARARAVPVSLQFTRITPRNLARVRNGIPNHHHTQLALIALHFVHVIDDYAMCDWWLLWCALRPVMPRLEQLALTTADSAAVLPLPGELFSAGAPRLRHLTMAGSGSLLPDRPLYMQFPALTELQLSDACGVRLPPVSSAHTLRALSVHFVELCPHAEAWLRAIDVRRIPYVEVSHGRAQVQRFVLQAGPRDRALRRITIEDMGTETVRLTLGFDGGFMRVVDALKPADASAHLEACTHGATELRCSATRTVFALLAHLPATVRAGLTVLEPVFTIDVNSFRPDTIDGKSPVEFARGLGCSVLTVGFIVLPPSLVSTVRGRLATIDTMQIRESVSNRRLFPGLKAIRRVPGRLS